MPKSEAEALELPTHIKFPQQDAVLLFYTLVVKSSLVGLGHKTPLQRSLEIVSLGNGVESQRRPPGSEKTSTLEP